MISLGAKRDSDATVKRVIRHDAGWISNPLPTKPLDESLRLLDDYAEQVAKYRG